MFFKKLFISKSLCRLFLKPIEHNDQTSSPNFEFPVFEAKEDDVERIPDEMSRLLEQEKKITQLHLENQQNSQLGHYKKKEKKEKEEGAKSQKKKKEINQNQEKEKEKKTKEK